MTVLVESVLVKTAPRRPDCAGNFTDNVIVLHRVVLLSDRACNHSSHTATSRISQTARDTDRKTEIKPRDRTDM